MTTLILLALGTLLTFLLEYHNPDTIGQLSFGNKWTASAFQSVTTRTAGYSTFSQAGMHEETRFLNILLMFIGGSPGGTAGGVKTSTGKVIYREYREKHNRQRSIDAALLDREFSRFTASPNYMLNCGLGTFLMPLCAIAVLWKGGELFEMLDVMFAETEGSVTLLLCVVFCGLVSMNFMTAPSVSLERKSLWLLQSLPVELWQIFRAKIRMQLLLTGLPLLLCVGCTEAVYSMYWMQLLMILLFGGSYMLLMAQVGLFLGIKMPTLTWTNEIMPIKQGGAVIITLLCGFVYMILLFAGFMLLPGWRLGFCRYMICFVGANLFLSGWIYLWLRKKGTTRFSAL